MRTIEDSTSCLRRDPTADLPVYDCRSRWKSSRAVLLSQPFREVTFCASYKCHCLGSCGSRLSWLWGEGVPSRVARGAPNGAAAARDDLAPAYPTLNM